MHHIFRIIAIILLLFNAISALFGGWGLMSDPSGETMEMPLRFLEHLNVFFVDWQEDWLFYHC